MMFEYQGKLDIIKILKDEYNYTFKNLEDLYKQNFIELEGNGVDALFWIKYKGEKYLFKPTKLYEYNVWGELLSEEIAKEMGLKSAEYRIATLGNMKGVITKSVLKKDETLIMGTQLFQEYLRKTYDTNLKHRIDELFKGKFLNHYEKMKLVGKLLNNYTDVMNIINSRDYLDNEIKENISIDFKKKLFFDIMTMQGDKHSNNWGIVKGKNYYRPVELYDSATSFGLNFPYMNHIINDFKGEVLNYRFHNDIERLRHFSNIPLLFTYYPNETKKTSREVLEDLLNNATDDEVEKYYSYLSKIDIDYLDNIISKLEVKNGENMDNDLKFYILNLYELNRMDLNETFRKRAVLDDRIRTI